MKKVAVTGGIGSGKSVVCKVFQQIGIPVFYADDVAKELINTSPEIRKKLTGLFGSGIYLQNGIICRKKLANIIFNNNIALEKINAIVHPVVKKTFDLWAEQQKAPYVIEEAAIVFESKQTANFDAIITVTAPPHLKIERVMKRDNLPKKKVLERMKNQLSDDIKIKNADFVIVNDNRKMVLPQILAIHNKLKSNGKIW